MAAPWLSAVIAAPDNEPKLIAETFTIDSGRQARRRPCAAPSTLAHGTANPGSSTDGSPNTGGSGNAACLMMM